MDKRGMVRSIAGASDARHSAVSRYFLRMAKSRRPKAKGQKHKNKARQASKKSSAHPGPTPVVRPLAAESRANGSRVWLQVRWKARRWLQWKIRPWIRWTAVLLIISVLSDLGGVLGLSPRFQVTAQAPLDPGNPLSTPFTISYDGLLPVRNVRVACLPNFTWNSQGKNGDASKRYWLNLTEARFLPDSTPLPWVARGTEWTSGCVNREGPVLSFGRPMRTADGDVADLTVEVEYTAFFRPTRKLFRFVSAGQSDGYLRLVPWNR